MKEFRIRLADGNDLEVLKDLSERTFVETFSEMNTKEDLEHYLSENLSLEKLQDEIKNPSSDFYLVECEGAVAAYMKINFNAAQTEAGHDHALEIQRVYVLEAYKNQGIGKMLVEQAVEVGKRNRLRYIWLGVWEKNHRAIRFYKKQGFVKFGQHPFLLGTDEQVDDLMKRPL